MSLPKATRKCIQLCVNSVDMRELNFDNSFVNRFDRNKLLASVEQLIKMKMYTTVFSIIHCIRQQQKQSTKKLLSASVEDMYFLKILKSALHQKEPQLHCKFQITSLVFASI